jgi:calcineurin-like phosphoesterase family protein
MASLFLSDILKRNGLDPKRTKLIRHSLNHDRCKKCYEKGCFEIYQSLQDKNFFNNCDFLLSFISEPGTSAKFIGCFEVGKGKPVSKELMPQGFPVPEMFEQNYYIFELKKTEIMSDLIKRLIIDWGKATVSWHQWATNEKAVLAIQANPKYEFKGFDKVILKYAQLKEIISDKTLYENWHTALSSVYAIYLIVDETDGKQYVGSAYGSGGLFARWKCYVETMHGGDVKIKELICDIPERYENFQFSILQILPKNMSPEEVIELENLFNSKLLSRKFGLNMN